MKHSRPPQARMYYIDAQLRENCYPNCTSIARHFEVSPKSIHRDIEYMRIELDAPIKYDPQKKGYFYTQLGFFLPAVFLVQQEADAVRVTEKVLSQYKGTPYYEMIKRALDKVLQYLPSTFSAGEVYDVYSFEQPSSSAERPECFAQLDDAAKKQLKVVITYHSPANGEISVRTVHPYDLHYSHLTNSWCLIAYCEFRKDMRTFFVNLIQKIAVSTEHFSVPESFSMEMYMKNGFCLTNDETEYLIEIRFSPHQAQWIREHIWHPSQEIREQKDGSIVLKMRVAALDAVRRWVMRYGADAEVIKPEPLRTLIKAEIKRLQDLYN